jgi:hypothetical protein
MIVKELIEKRKRFRLEIVTAEFLPKIRGREKSVNNSP